MDTLISDYFQYLVMYEGMCMNSLICSSVFRAYNNFYSILGATPKRMLYVLGLFSYAPGRNLFRFLFKKKLSVRLKAIFPVQCEQWEDSFERNIFIIALNYSRRILFDLALHQQASQFSGHVYVAVARAAMRLGISVMATRKIQGTASF